MVIPVGPGKFYGSSLPRPRYYTDVMFNSERVDPPVSVLDPLLSWANEAHWSMGGLSFKRLRLQGRIEGNVNKLRIEREKIAKKQKRSAEAFAPDGYEIKSGIEKKRAASVSPPPAPIATKRRRFMALFDEDEDEIEEEVGIAKKGNGGGRKKPVRKLGDDFDRVASENSTEESEKAKGFGDAGSGKKKASPVKGSSPVRTRSRRSEDDGVEDLVTKVVQEVNQEGSNSKGKKLKAGKKGKSNTTGRSSPVTVSPARTSPRLAKRESS